MPRTPQAPPEPATSRPCPRATGTGSSGREKIAQQRAEEARRKRRRLWLAGAGAVVVVIAAVVGITLALSGGSPKTAGVAAPKLNLAPLSTLGTLKPAPAPGPLGPEGVPHAADGVIHIESPVQRTYTLGNFFDIWGQPLGTDRVGLATGHVVVLYNGQVYQGNPRDIPLTAHAQIQLQVGTPLVAPEQISWPSGL